jgi:hypothetical protein
MGRSKVNSKVEKRLTALKRKIMAPIWEDALDAKHQKLLLGQQGLEYRNKAAKNAFLNPTDPEAKFPQFVPAPIIDLRANKSEHSGLEHRGRFNKKAFGHIVEIVQYDTPLDVDMGVEAQVSSEANTFLRSNNLDRKNIVASKVYVPNPDDELTDMMGSLTVGSKKTKKDKAAKGTAMAEEKVVGVAKKIVKRKRNRAKAF